ncbi:2'-5' RNA ligase family protein [Chitinophagaceae bacterium 26-R-25]|nr:2'-5' RNA ligase family protein [Chitinophagaceae bacterium 26-R-25]
MSRDLYFIAIIPPQDICDEITSFKKEIARDYDSHRALKVIPHITLKAPFRMPAAHHAGLFDWFRDMYVNTGSFTIDLENFGAFHTKSNPVIFVHPVMNVQLAAVQKEIIRSFHNHYPDITIMDVEHKFTPHMTIAYRDLEFSRFQEAWKVYHDKEYKRTFTVNDFHLLQHDGEKWNVVETYGLSKK